MTIRVSAFAALLLLVASVIAAQVYPVDYSVYFWPDPSVAPEKVTSTGQVIERRWTIVYNVGQGPGTHSYKLQLRVTAPNGTLACETTAIVEPWTGKYTMKKVAWFEAKYPLKREKRQKVTPGKYSLKAYLIEQIPAGQQAQDTDTGNNQFPFASGPGSAPVEFDVRPGAEEIRCSMPSIKPGFENLPAGFQVKTH